MQLIGKILVGTTTTFTAKHGGFLAWAFDPVKEYLTERKEATFTEVMQMKARKLGLALAA